MREAAKKYKFRLYDRYVWRNMDYFLCKRSRRRKEELKRAWALATKACVQREISWVNMQLGPGPDFLNVSDDITEVVKKQATYNT